MNISKSPFDLFDLWMRWGLGWIPFWIASFFIIRGAVAPPDEIPASLEDLNDKAVHGAQYFLLFLFSVNAFIQAKTHWIQGRFKTIAWFYCLAIGILTETLQIFTPDRSAEVLDWVADGIGATLALGLFILVHQQWKLSQK